MALICTMLEVYITCLVISYDRLIYNEYDQGIKT